MQQALDSEISGITHNLRLLRTQRNALSAVSALSFETLGQIFAISSKTHPLKNPKIRFNFSFVSRHWRSVALATPDLWSTVSHSNPYWIRICVRRSKATSLKLAFSLNNFSEDYPSLLSVVKEVLQEHGPRIQHLALTLRKMGTQEAQSVLNALPSEAPRLRVLRLSISCKETEPRVPSGCLTGACLNTLELRGCSIDWTSSFLHGLRLLMVGDIHTCAPAVPMYHALQNMHNLQVLHMTNVQALGAGEKNLINFPNLQRFFINAEGHSIVSWLSVLSVPSGAFVDIQCREGSRLTGHSLILALRSSVAQFFQLMSYGGRQSPYFISLDIRQYSCVDFFLAASSTHSTRGSYFDPLAAKTQNFSFHITSEHWSTNTFLEEIVQALPLVALQKLWLSLGPSSEVNPEAISLAFGGWNNLADVCVDQAGGFWMTKALSIRQTFQSGSRASSTLPFAKLKCLSFDFQEFHQDESQGLTALNLEDCLIERKIQGAMLQRLILTGPTGLETGDIERLRTAVGILECHISAEEDEEDEEEEELTDDDPTVGA